MNTFLKDRPVGKTLAGVLLLGLGLACLVFVVFNLAKDIPIWVLGRHTIAKVVDVWFEQTSKSEEKGLGFRYFVRYQFTTPDGQVFTGTSSAGPEEWIGLGMDGPVIAVYREQEHIPPFTVGSLEKGGSVAVVYFPPCPAHNRLAVCRRKHFLSK